MTATIGSELTGNSALVKDDHGTLVLTGANSYSGGTTIATGTLQLGDGGTSGSVIGNISNNAVLALNRSDDVTLAGVISGTGTVSQVGTGTVTLTGVNTYTGGTTISAGALIGSATSFGSGAILNDGALIIDQAADATLGESIQGTGTFTKQGAGALTLTGANTYTGGTTIAGGRLVASSGGVLGSGAVGNAGVLQLDFVADGTLANGLQGSGGLIKTGGRDRYPYRHWLQPGTGLGLGRDDGLRPDRRCSRQRITRRKPAPAQTLGPHPSLA